MSSAHTGSVAAGFSRRSLGQIWLYALGALIILGLKWFYSHAGADELDWILAPTARLAGLLSGISFEREAHVGWISRSHLMIVAPSCAGINFLCILFATLFFSFLHRLESRAGRVAWAGVSLGVALIFTIGTNALRLVMAINLHQADIYDRWFTWGRVHELAGTVIYCLALLVIHRTAEACFDLHASRSWSLSREMHPFCWYLLLTLGVPLANRAYRLDPGRFVEHSLMVVAIPLLLAAGLHAWKAWRRKMRIAE